MRRAEREFCNTTYSVSIYPTLLPLSMPRCSLYRIACVLALTLQISVCAYPFGSSEPRNSTTIVRCIGSKKAASQRSRTSQEDNTVKPKSLALGIAAIRKVTIFPVLWISNCTWQRDSGLSNVAFGNTAVCITRCIGTVQSFRIHREPVVSHCPLLLVQ